VLNKRQQAAVERLAKALDYCDKVGLTGGVYEYAMRLWPKGADPDPRDCGRGFFEEVDKVGATARSKMILDGGSGV
jgi:hypothetical protein